MRCLRPVCLAILAFALCAAPLFSQGRPVVPEVKVPDDPSIVSTDLDKLGLAVKMRPIVTEITTGDPLRLALHFEKPDGPITHADQELAPQMIDHIAMLRSLELAVKSPGGDWQVLELDDTGLPKDRASSKSLVSNGTFLFELGAKGLKLIHQSGREELSMPLDFGELQPGEYQVALRGTLKLYTQARKVRKRGEPPMDLPGTEAEVDFKTKPITITVERADMRNQTLEELTNAAVEELKKLPAVKEEELTVGDVESIPIADDKGNRVIRIRANMPQPKVEPGGPIRPLLPGGTGYWQYEVTMSPAGKAVSFGRARKGFCIARGTKISTPDGELAVEKLQDGQQVWAWDTEEKALVPATVLAVLESRTDETILINGSLRLSPEHPVFVIREGGHEWKVAAELQGDVLLNQERKQVKVTSLKTIGGEVDVFDVAVDGPHNFFAAGLLVHNKSIAWTPHAFVPWYSLWNRAPVK